MSGFSGWTNSLMRPPPPPNMPWQNNSQPGWGSKSYNPQQHPRVTLPGQQLMARGGRRKRRTGKRTKGGRKSRKSRRK